MTGILVFGVLLTSCNPVANNDRNARQNAGQDEFLPACRIGVPADPTRLKPGQACTVTLVLSRSITQAQDIDLTFATVEQIEITPASLHVKAADSSAVQVQLKAPWESRPGTYEVTVFGKSASGPRASAAFQVRILPHPLAQNGLMAGRPVPRFSQSQRLDW